MTAPGGRRAAGAALALATLLVAAPCPATAQAPADAGRTATPDLEPAPWLESYFAYPTAGTNDGPALVARYRWWQPAAWDDRLGTRHDLVLEAGATPVGSRGATLRWAAPRLAPGWRFGAEVRGERDRRAGFYGLGNDAEAPAIPGAPLAARVDRTRYQLRADVTRAVAGRLAAAAGVTLTAARWAAHDGPSVFRDAVGARLAQDDALGRLALVWDARDTEFDTRAGLLLEAGAQRGTFGGGYTRLYGIARGWAPLTPTLTLAARVLGAHLTGTPTLDAQFTLPAWDRTLQLVGNETSHRALPAGRLGGPGVLLGNLELRWEPLSLGELGSVLLVPFVDAGRVFGGAPAAGGFTLTTAGLGVGGGAGVGMRFLRTTVVLVNLATGPEGLRCTVNYGWMF